MRRRRVIVEVFGLIAVLLAQACLATGASAAPGPATRTTVVSGVEACQDVMFIGARGSDEPSAPDALGSRVRRALDAYLSATPGYRIGVYGVTYPAQDVKLLLTADRKRYWDGLDAGVGDVLGFLAARQIRCPRERVVLAGYSQGAMLVHRVAHSPLGQQLAARKAIDGLILIADGDRVGGEGARSFGTSPNTGRGSYGVSKFVPVSAKYPFVDRPLPLPLRDRTFSVCNALDIVCDTAGLLRTGGVSSLSDPRAYLWLVVAGWTGLRVHGGYMTDSAVQDAARAAAANTKKIAPRAPMHVVNPDPSEADQGQPYRWEFTAAGGEAPYRYEATTGLPAGLSLLPGGVLSGRVLERPGIGYVEFTLRVIDVAGQILDQPVRISVRSGAVPTPVVSRLTATDLDGQSPSVSDSGRYVAFISSSSGVVAGDSTATPDVFVYDRTTATAQRATSGTPEQQLYDPRISGNGHYVVYAAQTVDPDSADPPSPPILLRWDRTTGQTQQLTSSDANASAVDISDSGDLVTFSSTSERLVAGDTNGQTDIFLLHVGTGAVERLTDGDAESYGSRLSGDGRFVVFSSRAANLNGGPDTNPGRDIFRLDRNDGSIVRITSTEDSVAPVVSDDGATVAWVGDSGVSVWRASTGIVVAPAPPAGASGPSISADGRTVVWHADPTGEASTFRVYRWHPGDSTTDSAPYDGSATFPKISGDGSTVVFEAGNVFVWNQ